MIDSKLIAEAQKALDDADVPKKGREIHFIGKDGQLHTMRTDEITPLHIVEQIPEWMIEERTHEVIFLEKDNG